MRKKLMGGSLAVLLLALAAYGTAAYFTAETRATNVITTGTIDISLEEYTRDDKGDWVTFPEDGIQGVMPGTSVDKLVSVSNDGTADAWVRVVVTSKIVAADGKTELPLTLNNGEEVLSIDVQDGWTRGRDGVYYFDHTVAPETCTVPVFTQVTFNPAMGNEYQGCTAYMDVQAQAVQVKNNGDNVLQADGWPATGDTPVEPEEPPVAPVDPPVDPVEPPVDTGDTSNPGDAGGSQAGI